MTTTVNLVGIEDLLNVVFDGVVVGEDAIGKHFGKIFIDVISLFKDIPSALINIGDLKAEILALPGNPDAQQNLVSYLEKKISTVAIGKIQQILDQALEVVMSIVNVIEKLYSLKNML